MSYLAIAHETAASAHQAVAYSWHVANSLHADDLNPAPKPPKGVGNKAGELMGNVKWGALVVIIACGFIGAGAIAGGKFLSHHKTSQFGVGALLAAVMGALIWVGIYPFLHSITG